MSRSAAAVDGSRWGAAVKGLLVEPLPLDPTPVQAAPRVERPVVAVAGLAERVGTTTIARSLGAELALRDPDRAAIVSAGSVPAGGLPFGTLPASRLARALVRALPARARPLGRLCLAEAEDEAALVEATPGLAPLVLDVWDPARLAIAASVADAVVLVAAPDSEPALARVLADSPAWPAGGPVTVLNRDLGDADRWAGAAAVRVPENRFGARLGLAGREAPGELGRAVASLADLLAEAV